MCGGARYWSKIGWIAFGAADERTVAAGVHGHEQSAFIQKLRNRRRWFCRKIAQLMKGFYSQKITTLCQQFHPTMFIWFAAAPQICYPCRQENISTRFSFPLQGATLVAPFHPALEVTDTVPAQEDLQ